MSSSLNFSTSPNTSTNASRSSLAKPNVLSLEEMNALGLIDDEGQSRSPPHCEGIERQNEELNEQEEEKQEERDVVEEEWIKCEHDSHLFFVCLHWNKSTHCVNVQCYRAKNNKKRDDDERMDTEEDDEEDDGPVTKRVRLSQNCIPRKWQRVGRIEGHLLARPHENFHQEASRICHELHKISMQLFDANGRSLQKRVPAPSPTTREQQQQQQQAGSGGNDDEEMTDTVHQSHDDLSPGAVLHVKFIETTIRSPSCNLGLYLLHYLLVFLRDSWSILVMDIYSLPASCSEFVANQSWLLAPNIVDGRCTMTMQEERQALERKLKVQRHLSRMGLQQAAALTAQSLSAAPDLANVFYLKRDTYFKAPPPNSSGNDMVPASLDFQQLLNDHQHIPSTHWLSREQAKGIEIHVAPTARQIRWANDQLKRAIHKGHLEDMQRAIDAGANIHSTCALHVAVMTCNGTSEAIVDALLQLGARVDQVDHHMGQTPLHLACGRFSHSIIAQLVVRGGANLEIQNNLRQLPVLTFIQVLETHRKHLGEDHLLKQTNIMNQIMETMYLLTPQHMKAVYMDDWLSPRTRKALVITSSDCVDRIRAALSTATTNYRGSGRERTEGENEGGIPLSRVELFEYLELERHTKVTKDFIKGWMAMFEAILSTLKNNQTPTLEHVQTTVEQMDEKQRHEEDPTCDSPQENDPSTSSPSTPIQAFFHGGGKLEHAMDCVLDQMGHDWQMLPLEHLPVTPLDLVAMLTRYKCFEGHHNDDGFSRGPHHHTSHPGDHVKKGNKRKSKNERRDEGQPDDSMQVSSQPTKTTTN